MASGAFIAVVGPSGAGKDTLIAHARSALAGGERFLFARRMVTRPANAFEDHDTIDTASFEAGHASGRFALSWRAHGLGYALPASIAETLAGGTHVVCNLSRAVLPLARSRFDRVVVVEITAPPEVLAARLEGRGRESRAAIEERLAREAAKRFELRPDLIIMNDRPVAETGGRLVAFLSALATENVSETASP
ncbi:ribose 1,5-bisphosphokinase [Kaistia soli DSM 19436]|uniref:Ribose 1,5-bisphosphate phosphokinase PhnN n=1 Tax=Kaistia soli DSM 19436 TaxID=1122133 RepID=A0A1M4XIH5_9HYPH|nr:phosphonate metabolism protein/1,5-bisphosphokinase (PRPP-forming) PhnN [Kaistia soli]SHE93210.1 ribose 1,5-bisphosphokinase [Kaistia soli DSM 19436]